MQPGTVGTRRDAAQWFLKQAMGMGVAAVSVPASEDIFASGDLVEDAFGSTKTIGIIAA